MAKTILEIEQQIAKLRHRADAICAKEVRGVIARVQEAIEH
jgi:hypothetical protein